MTPLQLTRLQTILTPAAVAAERATGIPAELMAAQCALESAWLSSAPANNAFGIKDYPGSSGRQLLDTYEWFTVAELNQFLSPGDGRTAGGALGSPKANGRQLYRVKDWFATFPDLAGCFAKYAHKFTAAPYAPMLAAYRKSGDLSTLVASIARVYATSPTYADSLFSIIRMPEVTAALASARQSANTVSA